jgi:hypothetical protein
MVFQHIENLQQEYTDKHVVVNEEQPELKRFKGMTGIVRTVNMNGRALVEFDGDNNIGWYDIDIDFIRVIDEPVSDDTPVKEPPAARKEEKEDKAPSELKKARKDKDRAEMSVDEILAAAKEDAESGAVAETAEEPAAADSSAMSVDDILAAARGDAGGAAETVAEEEAAGDEDAAEAVQESPAEEPAASTGDLPADVDGIITYCQRVDGGE